MKNNAILTFSYVNEESDLNISNRRKVIRMSLKGFSIAVISGNGKAEQLLQYSFVPNDLSVEDKLNTIKKVNQGLNISCTNNLFRLYTQYNVQVPEQFYEQENDAKILSLMIDNSEDYVPFSEKSETWNLYNISAWKKDLYFGIKKKFPDYELNTVLISLLPIVARQKNEKEAFVFVGDNNFTIMAVDRQKLLGINTFNFVNEGDFLYYLYGFIRKMYLYPDNVSLTLGGNIAVKSTLYDILNKYFSVVEMATVSDAVDNYSYFCDLFEG